jgi:hypothetical protein
MVRKIDIVLFEQLRKCFRKLGTNPECSEVLSHDKAGRRACNGPKMATSLYFHSRIFMVKLKRGIL